MAFIQPQKVHHKYFYLIRSILLSFFDKMDYLAFFMADDLYWILIAMVRKDYGIFYVIRMKMMMNYYMSFQYRIFGELCKDCFLKRDFLFGSLFSIFYIYIYKYI